MFPMFNLSEIKVETEAEAVTRAERDYMHVLGQVIYPAWIYGYIGDTNKNAEVAANFRVGVRVLVTSPDSIVRWMDEFIDPCWDVEIVDDPDELAQNIRSAYVSVQSYETPKRALTTFLSNQVLTGEKPTANLSASTTQ